MYFIIMSTCGCFNIFEQTNIMYFLLRYESLSLEASCWIGTSCSLARESGKTADTVRALCIRLLCEDRPWAAQRNSEKLHTGSESHGRSVEHEVATPRGLLSKEFEDGSLFTK